MNKQVYTLDDKHTDDQGEKGRHCWSTFSDPQKMLKNMKKSFGQTPLDIQFGIIIMDYFFMPEGSWIMKAWQKEIKVERKKERKKKGKILK